MNLRRLLPLLFLLTSLFSNSQSFTLALQDDRRTALVGIDNRFSCTVEGVSCKSVFLTTNNGKITKTGCNNYVYVPALVSNSAVISIHVKYGKKNRVIGSETIKTREISDAVAMVGGISGGTINKNYLSMQQGVVADIYPTTSVGLNYIVKSFHFSVLHKDSLIFQSKNIGQMFSAEIKDYMKTLKDGDVVLISSIYCQKPDTSILPIKPLQLIVTD